MHISVKQEPNQDKWNKHIRMFCASPFISAPWLESFKNPGRKPVFFRFVSQEKTVGIIAGLVQEPCFHILKKIKKEIFFFSGPAVPESDKDLIRLCIASLTKYAMASGYTSLDIRSWDYPHVFDLEDLPYKNTREEFVIDMQGEFEDIRKKMRKRIHEMVRQGARNELTFHESDSPDLVEELTRLLEHTKSVRTSKGYEGYSYFYMPYFDKQVIYNLFQNKIAKIFYAKKHDKIISVKLVVCHGNRACALLAGTDPEGYKLKAPAFTWFNTIKKLREDGIKSYNIGGVANDSGASGLTFFKTSFGAEKFACVGGSTSFLQGPFLNLLYQVFYNKLPSEKILGRFQKNGGTFFVPPS